MIALAGRPIAISGASSGIGRAAALACARAGMPVALGARREDRLHELAGQIRRSGGRAIAVACDVGSDAGPALLVDRAIAEFGSLYAVFANAGYGEDAAYHESSEDRLREMFEVNFFGTTRLIRAALPTMLDAHAGHILICSSCLARLGVPFHGPYCASKAAQALLGRSLRHELEPSGIHVSTVFPIGTRTEFTQAKAARSGQPGLVSRAPRGFVQSPERVARAVLGALRRPRTEVWTSASVRLGFAALAAFPALADLAMRRYLRHRAAPITRSADRSIGRGHRPRD